jgi:hypothetical protein
LCLRTPSAVTSRICMTHLPSAEGANVLR